MNPNDNPPKPGDNLPSSPEPIAVPPVQPMPIQFQPPPVPQVLPGLYIPIFHTVDANLALNLTQAINQALLAGSLKKLYLPISNGGGQIAAGLAIYEYLCSLPEDVDIITHNVGSVDSAAVLIYMAGRNRYAVKGSSFLLHPVRNEVTLQNPSAEEAATLREIIDRHTVQYADILAAKSKLKAAAVQKHMRETKALSAKEALDVGIVHEIERLPDPLSIIRGL